MSVVKKDKEKEFMGGHTEPLSYADWLKSQGGISYTNDITQTDSAKYAEELLKRAQQGAQSAYDKSVMDANTRYKFNTSAYGAGAEQKIGSGMSNSGYAKYLTDRAYSTMVDEQIAAKGALGAANREAQNAYNDAMESIKTGQKASFDTLLQRVNSGEFNDFNNVSMLGLNSNLSDDQMSTLYGAYIKSNENKAVNTFNNTLSAIGSGAYSTFDQVISSVGSTNLTTQQRESLYNAFMSKQGEIAASNGDNIGYLEASVASGQMSAVDASKQVKNALNSFDGTLGDFITQFKLYKDSGLVLGQDLAELGDEFTRKLKESGTSIFYTQDAQGNTVKMDYTKAKNLVDDIIATGLLNSIDADSLRNTLEQNYNAAEYAAYKEWSKEPGNNGKTFEDFKNLGYQQAQNKNNRLPVKHEHIDVSKDFANGTGQALGIDPSVNFGEKDKASLWYLGSSIDVYNEGEVTDPDVLNAVERIGLYDGAAFRYGGQDYIYSKGKVYKFTVNSSATYAYNKVFKNNISSKML